ncbi:MAG: HEAT repeat domain-containing protein, partial [Methanomicrobiales archaeon]|nr:HEAT repeat domain-containing protein [Methanomicrobiales archaeon]
GLGELQDPSTVPSLAGALRDVDSGVRWKAAEALGKIGEPAVGVLAEALEDADSDVRWKAAVALGISESPAAIDPLIHALADPDLFVRTRAAHSLSGFGDTAIQPVRSALASPDPLVRIGAAAALGEIGGESATHSLIQALADPDPSVRKAAVSAVTLHGEKAIAPLIASLRMKEVQDTVASVLAHLGNSAVEPLVHALESPDPNVQAGAEHALGLMANPDAIHALIAFRDAQKCRDNE